MGIYKRGNIYWYKFMWDGRMVRESTHHSNAKTARDMESTHRSRLAKGEVGIREKKQAPQLADYLKNDFMPYVETHFGELKPKTRDYYRYGGELLLSAEMGKLKLDEITSQHSAAFAAKHAKLSASTVNCGLRTLR